MSGLWCVNLGYGRKELADAAYRQLLELPYYNSFFQVSHPPAIELARLLVEVTPPQFNHVFFTGSGSEANDIVRSVRRYWDVMGQPQRRSSSAATTRITAAPSPVRVWAEWRRCTHRAACRSRASCTSASRIGMARAASCRRRDSGSWQPGRSRRRSSRSVPNASVLHRRADPGRRRSPSSASDLLAGGAEDRRSVRHPAGGRRSDLRLRPHRPLVRLEYFGIRLDLMPIAKGMSSVTCRSAASWSAIAWRAR